MSFDYSDLFRRVQAEQFPAGKIRMQDVMPGGDSHAWMLQHLKDFIVSKNYIPTNHLGALKHLANCYITAGHIKPVSEIILEVTLKVSTAGAELGGMTCYTEPPTSDFIPPFVFLNDNPKWFSPNQQVIIAAHESAHLLTPAALRYHGDTALLEAIAYTSECVVMHHFGLDCLRDTARGLLSYKVDKNLYDYCVPIVDAASREIIEWIERHERT